MEACELCFVFSDEDPENVESEVGESCLSGVYVCILLYWDVRVTLNICLVSDKLLSFDLVSNVNLSQY